jgi:hypothetical protein
MNQTNWTIRGRILGTVMSVTALAISMATTAAAQSVTPVSGPHANEPFCKTIVGQVELLTDFVKLDNPDMAKRAKYFADAKALNATLVKTAPASLATDVALQTRIANAMYDAQIAGDGARMSAAAKDMTSPEILAASKRMSAYCGARISTSK